MITEDYVSFETAKFLKEKGFNEPCFAYYYIMPHKTVIAYNIDFPKNSDLCLIYANMQFGSLPTLQMACKWLREVHNLNVEVYRTACGYIGCIVSIPSGTDIKFLEDDGDDKASGTYTKSEYACEAAIKYCLEHLI